jgi:hypothetical protein
MSCTHVVCILCSFDRWVWIDSLCVALARAKQMSEVEFARALGSEPIS